MIVVRERGSQYGGGPTRGDSMTITAKFPGTCRRCGGKITVGEKIEWSREDGARHLECPKIDGVESGEKLIHIGGGEGYGYSEYEKGQFVWNRTECEDERALIVVNAGQHYYREDGMSFGVGDEQGFVYWAKCRKATAEERQDALDRAHEHAYRMNLQNRVSEIAGMISKIGEYPAPTDEGIMPDGERLFDTQDIYGGGGWFVISYQWIWYIRNNGMDGDNWANNNIRTCGAGAIGRRIPATPELLAELRMLADILTEKK
jgi:hypothetical protein